MVEDKGGEPAGGFSRDPVPREAGASPVLTSHIIEAMHDTVTEFFHRVSGHMRMRMQVDAGKAVT